MILFNINRFLHSAKWLQVLLLTLVILFNIIHSFAHSQMVPSIAMLYQSFNLSPQLKNIVI